MPYYVHGEDKPDVLAGLIENAEAHWSYMDQYADRLILRGPTLSDDGEDHTGSIHVVEVDDRAAAERFAYEEPNWSAGFYQPLTVVRAIILVNRVEDAPRTLVTAEWAPVEAVSPQFSDSELSFLALLVDDDGAKSIGLVAALTALPEEAPGVVSPVADLLSGQSAMLITAHRWQRGGRS